jgi:flagellar biosynthesis/type III secretory pathway M-ring protein FliF/YscJ
LPAIKQQLDQLAERISSLSVSSRLLVGSGMVILIMGLFLVAQYAGESEKAPLRVRPAALDATKSWLDTQGIDYSTDDAGRVMVAHADRQVIQVRLATESSVPPSELDWDAMLQDETASSIWDSPEVQRQRERRFTMSMLKVMVSNLQFVRDAQIAIDEPDQLRGPGRQFFPATASVTIATNDGPLTAGQARAIRSLVASGVSGMSVENVVVIDQVGNLFAGDDRGASAASQLDGISRGVESHYEQQIREVLGVEGLRVAVSALAEPRSAYETGREHGEPVTASKSMASETAKERAGGGGGRPGYASNVGPRVNAPMGVGSAQQLAEFEAESTNNDVIVDATDIAIENPGGYVYKLSAVLNIPRAYLVGRFSAEYDVLEPTITQLNDFKLLVRQELVGAISMMLQTPPPASNLKGDVVAGDVTVLFALGAAVAQVSTPGPGGMMADSVLANGASSPQIRAWILGGLAVLGIGAMFMIARRATRREDLPTSDELSGQPPSLNDDMQLVMGEVSEAEMLLDAREVDEDEIRRKQMLGQLNELVTREPSEAAVLVKQWIRQAG